MSALAAPRKRRHILAWLLAWVGLFEIIALAVIVLLARFMAPCLPNSTMAFARLLGGGVAAVNSADFAGNGGAAHASEASAPASGVTGATAGAAANAGGGASGSGGTGGDASATGDLNEVPDPNCVARIAASELSSGTPAPQPSCGALKAPAELKQAAGQVQNLGSGAAPAASAAATP